MREETTRIFACESFILCGGKPREITDKERDEKIQEIKVSLKDRLLEYGIDEYRFHTVSNRLAKGSLRIFVSAIDSHNNPIAVPETMVQMSSPPPYAVNWFNPALVEHSTKCPHCGKDIEASNG